MTDLPIAREYLMQRRRALIIELDAIEDVLEIHPRNRDLRRGAKEDEKQRVDNTEKKLVVKSE